MAKIREFMMDLILIALIYWGLSMFIDGRVVYANDYIKSSVFTVIGFILFYLGLIMHIARARQK